MVKLIPTILCGGAGSRLWPVSREMHPKPFMLWHDGQSLLQKTFLRALALPQVSEILTITNDTLFFQVQDAYQSVKPPLLTTSYILEPLGRNTAAAIAAGALYLQRAYPEDVVMLILSADHIIQDMTVFKQAVHDAMNLAQQDQLVMFGIQPISPETGYGYIQLDQTKTYYAEDGSNRIVGYGVMHFVEKPDADVARTYLASNVYFWNAGLFCFKISSVLQYMRLFCPEILSSVQNAIDAADVHTRGTLVQCRLLPELFQQVPVNAFDYAVIEPASKDDAARQRLVVVPCDMGWYDIGSWQVLWELADKDASGNCVYGQAFLHDTKNCFVHSPHRMIGAVGVENLMVIDTMDALLIAHQEASQAVKHVYMALKEKNHTTYRLHPTTYYPWGICTVLISTDQYVMQHIEVHVHAQLQFSTPYPKIFIVISGTVQVLQDECRYLLRQHESIFIEVGKIYTFKNITQKTLVMVTVQSGRVLKEHDSVDTEENSDIALIEDHVVA